MSDIIDFYYGKNMKNIYFSYDNMLYNDELSYNNLFDLQNTYNFFLESCHNYIQWMFPLDEPSAFNPDAPILTKEDINEFLNSFILKYNLYNSFLRFVEFLGFFTDQSKFGLAKFHENGRYDAHWLTENNHNLLRITRVLKSLSLLGLEEVAKNFIKCLEQLKKNYNDIITDETWAYWENAVT